MTEAKDWGVKCTTEMGWYGLKHPAKYTEAEARRMADLLNAIRGPDRWEARKL